MENWNQVEVSILVWIQDNLRTELFDCIMPFISMLNNSGMISIFTVVVLLLWRRYRHVGVTAAFSLFTEFLLLNVWLKNMVHRTRPYVMDTNLILLGDRPGDFSFPSGHAAVSFAGAFAIFMHNKKWGVAAIALAALIGFSRLYLYVHFPTDVLAGAFVGALCAVISYFIVKFVFKQIENKKGIKIPPNKVLSPPAITNFTNSIDKSFLINFSCTD